ncbi:hypothetical protein JCM10207_005997 [Rhodosporidiobolus poonsookiae]
MASTTLSSSSSLSASPPPSSTSPPAIAVSQPPSPSSSAPHSPLAPLSSHRSSSPSPSPSSPSPATPRRLASSANRARSRSPQPGTTHSLSALGGPGSPPSASAAMSKPGPPPVVGSAIRPSPVVPPSPSVPPTPSFSRPTSPRPGMGAAGAGSEPSSPTATRARASSGGPAGVLGGAVGVEGGTLSQSASQVDLSHIFERDVEFAPSHLITPSEAVDVAVPPVLTEAAVALSHAHDDPFTERDLAALVLDAEHDAQAGSGWSSPVHVPALSALAHPHPQPHPHQPVHASPLGPAAHMHAHSSRSPARNSRSFSPDSAGASAGRAVSPDSSTSFSVGTPPTSTGTGGGGASPPPQAASLCGEAHTLSLASQQQGSPPFALGPFGQRLAEALENEANKLPPPGLGGVGLVAAPNSTTQRGAGRARETSPDSVATSSSGGGGDGAGSAGSRTAGAGKAATYTPLKPSLLLPFPQAGLGAGGLDDPFASFSPASTSASALSTSPLHSPSYELANPFGLPPSSGSPSAAAAGAGAGGGLAAPNPRRISFVSYADLINEERILELKGEAIPSASVEGVSTPGLGVGPGAGGAAGSTVGSRNVSGSSARKGAGIGAREDAAPAEGLEAKMAAAVLEP